MECLPGEYHTELVSSPMERALQTAEALAAQLSTQAEFGVMSTRPRGWREDSDGNPVEARRRSCLLLERSISAAA